MKKLLYVLALFAFVFCVSGCSKAISLDEIVEKFNNCETVKTYKGYNIELKATKIDNEISIVTTIGQDISIAKYKLNGNILENENLTTNDLISALILIDCIGQVYGYKDGELAENINAFTDEVLNYTLDKEGLEFKTSEESGSLKVDLTKKIPLIDMDKFFLRESEFLDNTTGNSTGRISKLSYSIEHMGDKNYIYIGEEGKLTESAYKSILSALKVMYGTEVATNFKSVYPEFKDGTTNIDAFTIETNYQVEDKENSIFKDSEVVKVTIDNNKIK